MEFRNGKPTYRLRYGYIGESHAISVAERVELPSRVVARARALLDDGARQVCPPLGCPLSVPPRLRHTCESLPPRLPAPHRPLTSPAPQVSELILRLEEQSALVAAEREALEAKLAAAAKAEAAAAKRAEAAAERYAEARASAAADYAKEVAVTEARLVALIEEVKAQRAEGSLADLAQVAGKTLAEVTPPPTLRPPSSLFYLCQYSAG